MQASQASAHDLSGPAPVMFGAAPLVALDLEAGDLDRPDAQPLDADGLPGPATAAQTSPMLSRIGTRRADISVPASAGDEVGERSHCAPSGHFPPDGNQRQITPMRSGCRNRGHHLAAGAYDRQSIWRAASNAVHAEP
jgi:hypothetical protein